MLPESLVVPVLLIVKLPIVPVPLVMSPLIVVLPVPLSMKEPVAASVSATGPASTKVLPGSRLLVRVRLVLLFVQLPLNVMLFEPLMVKTLEPNKTLLAMALAPLRSVLA